MRTPPWRPRTEMIERARRIVQQARHRSIAATRIIRTSSQRATRVVRVSTLASKAQDNWIVLLAIGLLLISLLLARISALGRREVPTSGTLEPGLSEPSGTALAQLEGTPQPSASAGVLPLETVSPTFGTGAYPEPFPSPIGIGTPPAGGSALTPGLPSGGSLPGITPFPTLGGFPTPGRQEPGSPNPGGPEPGFPTPGRQEPGFPTPGGSSGPNTQPGDSYPAPGGPRGVGSPPPTVQSLPPLPSPTRQQVATLPTLAPPPARGPQQPAPTPRPPAAQPTRPTAPSQGPGGGASYPQPGGTSTGQPQPTRCPSCTPVADDERPDLPTTQPDEGRPVLTPTLSGPAGSPTPEPTAEPTPAPPTPTVAPVRVISGQTRWQLADSPVLLDQDHIVEAGASLTIDPGVEVRLAPGVRLFVSGTLTVAGNAGAPVRFSSAGTGSWGGIRLNEGGRAHISGSRLTGAGAEDLALFASGASLVVEDSVISGGSGRIVSYNSNIDIRRTSIVDNDLAGSALAAVLGSGQQLTLVDNHVAQNRLAGGAAAVQVFVNGSSGLTIQGNRFILQGSSGTNLLLSSSVPYEGRIACNTLIGGAVGLDLDTSVDSRRRFSVSVEQNVFQNHSGRGAAGDLDFEVRNNWWGDPSGPYEATRNPSGRGDAVGVNLAFDPWLTSWPGCAPQP